MLFDHPSPPSLLPDCPHDVAQNIVSSRKSWKTVRGKGEAVWPPVLEQSLVRALLSYRPEESRTVKTLGRFPKRNRYISDFIYQETGIRRSPKQVGSRLQQLKDVYCGKQLLKRVSIYSTTSTVDSARSPGKRCTSVTEAGEEMPSPICNSNVTAAFDANFYDATKSDPYGDHTAYASCSTPACRRLDVFVNVSPNIQGVSPSSAQLPFGRPPLMEFTGCLTNPESVSPVTFDMDRYSTARPLEFMDPVVIFRSLGPIAARSHTTVLCDNEVIGHESHALIGTPPDAEISNEFIYTSELVKGHWELLCLELDITRYMVVQNIISNMDMPNCPSGQAMISIIYHFTSIASPMTPTLPSTILSPSPLGPTDGVVQCSSPVYQDDIELSFPIQNELSPSQIPALCWNFMVAPCGGDGGASISTLELGVHLDSELYKTHYSSSNTY